MIRFWVFQFKIYFHGPEQKGEIILEEAVILGEMQYVVLQVGCRILLNKGLFTLNGCNCDVANIWVLLVSMQLFTFSYVKYQRKILRSF